MSFGPRFSPLFTESRLNFMLSLPGREGRWVFLLLEGGVWGRKRLTNLPRVRCRDPTS